jgi:precorrin-6A/cobalt-precorrin-6A reductase
LPPYHELLLDRGPYALASELALIDRRAIDLIVTKDSGGEATEAKLAAARERRLPVILVERPPAPPGVPTVATVAAALSVLSSARDR